MLVKPGNEDTNKVKGEGRGILSPLTSYLLPLCLILAGAILLIVSSLTSLASFNLVLLSALIIIILGVVLYVRQQKSREKY